MLLFSRNRWRGERWTGAGVSGDFEKEYREAGDVQVCRISCEVCSGSCSREGKKGIK